MEENGENKSSSEPLHLDKILTQIGARGRFQLRTSVILWFSTACMGMSVIAFLFTGYNQKNRCAISECGEVPGESEFSTISDYLNGKQIYALTSKCKRYEFPSSQFSENPADKCSDYMRLLAESPEKANISYCSSDDLLFDKSIVKTSLVEHFDWTCSNYYQRSLINATYMLGLLVGSLTLGMISDHIGRKKSLILSILCVSLGGSISAFVTAGWLFGVLRFITGIGGMGSFMISFIIAVESTTPQHRVFISNMVAFGFNIGGFIFTFEAYMIRDWFTLQLVIHLPMLLVLIPLIFFVPESARWLLSKGKIEEALEVIQYIAEVNRYKDPMSESDNPSYLPKDGQNIFVETKKNDALKNLKLLFWPLPLLARTAIMFYQWISVTMLFYGLTFSFVHLSGDPYLNYFIGTFIQPLGLLFSVFFIDFFGRKFYTAFLQLISGISAVGVGLLITRPDLGALQVAMALLCKFCAVCTFQTMYIVTSELYPTYFRNSALGACSMFGRFGGIIALSLLDVFQRTWKPLPMVIYGSIAISAGFFAFFLPETTGCGLPENLEAALKIGKNSGFKRFSFKNVDLIKDIKRSKSEESEMRKRTGTSNNALEVEI